MFLPKSAHIRGCPPPWLGTPPHGKSWIRYCNACNKALKHYIHCMLCSCFTAHFTINYAFPLIWKHRIGSVDKYSYSCPMPNVDLFWGLYKHKKSLDTRQSVLSENSFTILVCFYCVINSYCISYKHLIFRVGTHSNRSVILVVTCPCSYVP